MSDENKLEWTDKLPKVPGLYLWLPSDTTYLVVVDKIHPVLCNIMWFNFLDVREVLVARIKNDTLPHLLEVLAGFWIGPVPELDGGQAKHE